jgi:hypothetical protein
MLRQQRPLKVTNRHYPLQPELRQTVLPTLSRNFSPGLQKNLATEKKLNTLVNFIVLRAFALQKKNNLCLFLLEN